MACINTGLFFPVSLINAVWTFVNPLITDRVRVRGQNVYRDDPAHSRPGFIECWHLENAL